jgi:hypothetical protein
MDKLLQTYSVVQELSASSHNLPSNILNGGSQRQVADQAHGSLDTQWLGFFFSLL